MCRAHLESAIIQHYGWGDGIIDRDVRPHYVQKINDAHGNDGAGVGLGTLLFPVCEEKFRVAFGGAEEASKQLLIDVKRNYKPTR